MHNYLLELFKEENTVIIPKLGALTIVDKNTGELMFMSYLRHNDGTLTNYIAQKEHISELDARKKVEQYVENIIQVIASGKTFEIQQIGSFKQEPITKEIIFVYNSNRKTPENIQPKIEKTTPNIIVKNENIAIKTTQNEEKNNASAKKINNVELKKNETKHETKPQENTTKAESKVITKTVTTKKATEQINNKNVRAKTAKPRKKRSAWVTVALPIFLMLMIGMGIYVALYYDELTQKTPISSKEYAQEKRQKETENTITEIETDSYLEEENMESENKVPKTSYTNESEEQESTPQVITSNGLHIDKNMPIQIIVGSFEDEDNVQKLIRRLKNKGIHAENIGQSGYLHLVSAASFRSIDEYREKQNLLKELGNYWVKKK